MQLLSVTGLVLKKPPTIFPQASSQGINIDLTSTYFEGEECILAKFGHPRGHSKDKLQIVIGFVVDQKGILVTHQVWPGNRTDAKSLKPMDRCINKVISVQDQREMKKLDISNGSIRLQDIFELWDTKRVFASRLKGLNY